VNKKIIIAMTSAPNSVADGQSQQTYVMNRNKVDLNIFLDKNTLMTWNV
jgi:hypothetical protein